MKELLMLGAGTGGAVAANMLNRRLNLKDWRITLVDRASTHVYQPGLLFIPFRSDQTVYDALIATPAI